MEFGASIFFTDYSITPTELAVEMEERGFDSVWAAEHSHIPVPRPTTRPGLSTGTIGGAPEDLDKLRRFRDLGAERVNVSLMSEARDDILPRLDKWAGYIRQLRD
jgi:hypothetical protein